MGYPVQQNSTAAKDDLLFFLADSDDHIAGKTGASPTVTIRKAGGAFSSPAGSVSELANGWYYVAANATDNGTAGPLLLHATADGADPCDDSYYVEAINRTDATRQGMSALPNAAAEAAGGLYTRGTGPGQINQAANGQIDVNAAKIGGTSQTGRDLGASVLISAGTGTGQLDVTGGVLKTNLVQILGSVLTETAGGYLAAAFKKLFDVVSPVLTAASVNQTGDAYARLGAPAGASHAADVAAVKSDTGAVKAKTDNLPSSPAAVGSQMNLADGALTSAKISLGTVNAGASGILERLMLYLYRKLNRATGPSTLSGTPASLTWCDDSGNPIASQQVSDNGTTQTQTKAT